MSTRSLSFGYYPRPLDLTVGPIMFESVPDFQGAIADIEASAEVDSGWIYAPPQRVSHLGQGVSERPYPARVFGLPKTHKLTHSCADNEDHLVFHLWTLSFFIGMRQTSTEAGFLDCTPIKPGKLVDFVLLDDGLTRSIELADCFWTTHHAAPHNARLYCAAIHALFLAQNPQHLQFERFLLLYTAFDACFALAKSLRGRTSNVLHRDRVAWMCDLFSMPIPYWADGTVPNGPEVASLRNETIHEALFMGEPLGFALHGAGTNRNLTLEMKALICRLLVAMLGAPQVDYVRSSVSTRQRQGLRFV